MKEELKDIRVVKIPNGYTLDFDGHGFMYYDLEALLEGFMYHVGLEELGAIDRETMKEFLAAAIVWKEQGGAIKEVVRLREENEYLNKMLNGARKQLAKTRKQIREMKNGSHSAPSLDDDDDNDD